MSDYFILKIQGLNNSQIELEVHPHLKISELHQKIESLTQIPSESQRLLYNTKKLHPNSTLSDYNITLSSTVLIVADILQPTEDETFNELIRSALEYLPSSYITNRRNNLSTRRELNVNEKLETVRQNLDTVELMIASSRKFKKGMWVDVKDTVDQWLEAQVTDVVKSGDGIEALVHYNGWPCRWDEWISVTSERIQYFKTQTNQSLTSHMHSPYPISNPDAGFILFPEYDLSECISQISGLADSIQVMIRKFRIHGVAFESLSAVLDRLGKAFSDIGGIVQGLEDSESRVSSVITNESGASSGVMSVQIPVMPTQAELALMVPRVASEFDVNIHAVFAIRGLERDNA